jgi:DNA-binding IclR family transcriptional regulator
MTAGAVSRTDLAAAIGLDTANLANVLTKLKKLGVVANDGCGKWWRCG